MGLFKSKAEKHNRRIRKMLGKQPLRIQLDTTKALVHINFTTFPVSEIDTFTVDYEQIDTLDHQDVAYDYDFWKGYAYSHLTDSNLGWFMGLKENVTTTKISVYRIFLRVNCIHNNLTQTFSAGVFLEVDPNLDIVYQDIWKQCAQLILKMEKMKKNVVKKDIQKVDNTNLCLKDNDSKMEYCYQSLIEGMDITMAQINKELGELSTAMQIWHTELEKKITEMNAMIDRYNELSEQKLTHIQQTGIQLQELLHRDAENLNFEGKKATYLIENGNYVAGEDIAVGKYHYVIISGSAYTRATSAKNNSLIISAAVTYDKKLPWVFRNLRLQNGDVLRLEGDAKGMLIRV